MVDNLSRRKGKQRNGAVTSGKNGIEILFFFKIEEMAVCLYAGEKDLVKRGK